MTTLLTITHDPQGKQLSFLSPELFAIFDRAFCVATEEMLTATPASQRILKTLKVDITQLMIKPKAGMCQARRDVVKFAWEQDAQADRFFYCDLDRLLFWWHKYPDELIEVVQNKAKFLVLGRTDRAMRTYPVLQYETERAMNRLSRLYYDYDLFAGARLFTPSLSRMLIQCQGEDAVLDVKWPLVAHQSGINVEYMDADGLAYEADFLGIIRTVEQEVELRCRNLKSILDYVSE